MTPTTHPVPSSEAPGEGSAPVAGARDARTRRLTADGVWHTIARLSFAIVSYVTPAGEPRSSGVVYRTAGDRLYVAVAPESWKARHIAASGLVSVVVPVRRGGILSLLLPIPPATITFRAVALVHPAGCLRESPWLPRELESLVPEGRRAAARILELRPEGAFVTYGIGVSLADMRHPAVAQARVPVG